MPNGVNVLLILDYIGHRPDKDGQYAANRDFDLAKQQWTLKQKTSVVEGWIWHEMFCDICTKLVIFQICNQRWMSVSFALEKDYRVKNWCWLVKKCSMILCSLSSAFLGAHGPNLLNHTKIYFLKFCTSITNLIKSCSFWKVWLLTPACTRCWWTIKLWGEGGAKTGLPFSSVISNYGWGDSR